MGFVGREEGVATIAVATVYSRGETEAGPPGRGETESGPPTGEQDMN
jgi:hypothetical protein